MSANWDDPAISWDDPLANWDAVLFATSFSPPADLIGPSTDIHPRPGDRRARYYDGPHIGRAIFGTSPDFTFTAPDGGTEPTYLGGHVYDLSGNSTEVDALRVFLTNEGYNPDDYFS